MSYHKYDRQKIGEQNAKSLASMIHNFLPEDEGHYALMQNNKVCGVFTTIIDANNAAICFLNPEPRMDVLYNYSIHKIEGNPSDCELQLLKF